MAGGIKERGVGGGMWGMEAHASGVYYYVMVYAHFLSSHPTSDTVHPLSPKSFVLEKGTIKSGWNQKVSNSTHAHACAHTQS